jgi:hypothetical protein
MEKWAWGGRELDMEVWGVGLKRGTVLGGGLGPMLGFRRCSAREPEDRRRQCLSRWCKGLHVRVSAVTDSHLLCCEHTIVSCDFAGISVSKDFQLFLVVHEIFRD